MAGCRTLTGALILASAACLTSAAVGLRPIAQDSAQTFIRASQLGYLPDDPKIAVVLSAGELPVRFDVVDECGRVAASGAPRLPASQRWGRFTAHGEIDF